jgi:hypothetical protein
MKTRFRPFEIVLIAFVIVGVTYLADYFTLRASKQPFGTVQVRRYYAMPLKGGKTEYGDAGVENETCVHALFPHSGVAPCWYASHKKEKWVTQ